MATEVERVVDESAALAPVEPLAAIHIHIGDRTYVLPASEFLTRLRDENLPDFVTGRGATGKAAALRSGIKALLPVFWPLITADVRKWSAELESRTGCPPLPLPDLKTRHPDGLIYAMRYIASLLIGVLCALEWEADSEPVGGNERYLRLTRLSARSAQSQAESADGPTEGD